MRFDSEFSSTASRSGIVMCVAAVVLLAASAPAAGQCEPQWSAVPHTGGGATALGSWDEDGSGPAPPMLYVAGYMTSIGVERAGGTNFIPMTGRIARFDGWAWYPVGEGFDPWPPESIFGAESSKRPILNGAYVGVEQSYINPVNGRAVMRWDGRSWLGVGEGLARGMPRAFALYDEGQGVTMIVGGPMRRTLGNPMTRGIARWNGFEWSNVGGGIQDDTDVFAFAKYNEGLHGWHSPSLFVAGTFRTAGSIEAYHIARWDGKTWSTVGELGTNASVSSLCVFDAGDGPMLYVGGSFARVGGPSNWIDASRLARWDGKEWSAVPGWTAPGGGHVDAMVVFDDDGPGPNKPALFIAGTLFGPAGTGSSNIVKWDGQTWHGLNGGLSGFGQNVAQLHVFDDDGDGPNPGGLYAAGGFTHAGGTLEVFGLARWGCPLTPPCLADCDFSTGFGTLDVFDFLCFLNRFHAGAPYACDCDVSTGHGVCDIFDFLCYGQRFQAGCP